MPRESRGHGSDSDCEIYVVSVRKVTGQQGFELEHSYGIRQAANEPNEKKAGPSRHRLRARSRSPEPAKGGGGGGSRRRRQNKANEPHENIISSIVSATSDFGESLVENIVDAAQAVGGAVVQLRPNCGANMEIPTPMDVIRCGRSTTGGLFRFGWTTSQDLTRLAWTATQSLTRFAWMTTMNVIDFMWTTTQRIVRFGWSSTQDVAIFVYRNKSFFTLVVVVFAIWFYVVVVDENTGATISADIQWLSQWARSALSRLDFDVIGYICRRRYNCWQMILYNLQHPVKFMQKFCVFCPN